jgi:hypothetical protein
MPRDYDGRPVGSPVAGTDGMRALERLREVLVGLGVSGPT